jgi:type IV pilus assembly protein PilQ
MKKSWKTKYLTQLIDLYITDKISKESILKGFIAGSIILAPNVYATEVNSLTTLPIQFVNSASVPKVTHIVGTNKLIIDFENAGDFKEEPKLKDNNLISDLMTQRNGEKLRIAIDTKVPVNYSIVANGNSYNLNLVKATEFSEVTEQPNVQLPIVAKSATESLTPQVLVTPIQGELEHVNLKATGKIAKLTLDLNDKSIVPTVTKSGNLLIIDLPGVKIPEEFQKSIAAANLGTVVQNMDIATQKGSGRIVLSQSDNWSYSVYQMDKRVVVEVKPNIKDVEKPLYTGKPLTLNFQNMDVRAILQVIADFTGLNIVSSDSVAGSMTVRLKDVPWDQALDLVLEAKNLQQEKQGSVIWVATRQEIADKNKSKLELNSQVAELAPLKLEFFQLNHYKAQDVKDILEGKTSSTTGGTSSTGSTGASQSLSLLSKRGTIGLDVRNNKIFIQDTEDRLQEIAKIIKKLDMASKQVLIEAKLVVVDDKFGRDLGAKFGMALGHQNGNTHIGLSNNAADATSIANAGTTAGSIFNNPVLGGGSIGFTILNAISGNMLNVELSALEQNNHGKVISNPRLLTADNKKAEIRQGTEIPYVTPGSSTSPATVAFKSAVLSLSVTPQVSPNGRVTMDLDISKDTIGQMVNVQGGGQIPSIDTRQITTQVTVNDGQTVILGGIYEVTSREDLSKVPLFGDIPFVGNLFKNTSKSNDKVELLIFITPHVITDEDLDAINKPEQENVTELDLKRK